MSIQSVVQRLRTESFAYEDDPDSSVRVELQPGFTPQEIDDIERKAGKPLPADFRALLALTSGLGDEVEFDFTGSSGGRWVEEIMPHFLALLPDGAGNAWGIDLDAENSTVSQVYFACHDAPVLKFVTQGVESFLSLWIEQSQPPYNEVLTPGGGRGERPKPIPVEEASSSSDVELRDFAAELGTGWLITDMRSPKPGDEFHWGKFGMSTQLKRYKNLPLFAAKPPEKRPGIFQRLFGKHS